ncbi:helicase HerA-like domain-containing protein, partial [Histophilus somni]|uniref:helicase HerA-like domain-containing protein n=1 Tax=Histophilus somni TaxID=731 RepID=UPI00201EDD59
TTISEMGPIILSKLMGLNDIQEGILNIAFKLADDRKLLLVDIKDLRAILNFVDENKSELSTIYGNISTSSIGAILRSLLVIEEQGGNLFFGEPAFDIKDFLRQNASGEGIINVLSSKQLYDHPALYSTFLLWLLSELYENMPEVGDLEKPKIVFFFDEAHLLFDSGNKILVDKIEKSVSIIRSKGVSVIFVTQKATDIPEDILTQLGNRIQHS